MDVKEIIILIIASTLGAGVRIIRETQIEKIGVKFDTHIRIKVKFFFHNTHQLEQSAFQSLREPVISQTITIQIDQTQDTAGLQVLGDIFDNIKTTYQKIFEYKPDPDKIKAAQVVERFTASRAKVQARAERRPVPEYDPALPITARKVSWLGIPLGRSRNLRSQPSLSWPQVS